MSRLDVTEKIIATKVARGIRWSEVADKVGLSKEWVTAACLGQMTLTAQQATVVGEIFGLDETERRWLQVVPSKGSRITPDWGAPITVPSRGPIAASWLASTFPPAPGRFCTIMFGFPGTCLPKCRAIKRA